MVFPTLNFLIFYLCIWPTSWLLLVARRHQLHKLAIIAGSYIFYAAWSTRFTLLLLASVCLNWTAGWLIVRSADPSRRKLVVGIGVALNLALLGYFKYWDFFIGNLDGLLRSVGLQGEMPYWEIVLPVGISFFTFQGISYIVDLYRGDLDRPRPFVDVMLFISFFPHLVAGPIVRASAFLPQLERPPSPNRVFVSLGICLIGWGVFKKAVVANWLSVDLVDPVFRTPLEYGGADLYEPLDLGIARCRLMTAGLKDRALPRARVRVATKFVNIAKQHFAERGIQADIIKLYGAMELAPLMNLADLIVDIVDTGNTLRANGMAPLELIAEISSRLVVNKAAMKCKHSRVVGVIESLRSAVAKRAAKGA